ncbi:MAG: transcriptional repressor [Tannerellaceae bacterium]|nr:transcriptional repressor [Tannerellaceae bacterium]
MEAKIYPDMAAVLTVYLTEKKLRKTPERYSILEQICTFPGHFDIYALHQKLDKENFHVSKSTVYNTVEVLVDAGILVRHQINSQSIQYELRRYAKTHLHLICTRCGTLREIKNTMFNLPIDRLKTRRFYPEHHSLYVYGLCSKCKYGKQRKI